MGRALVSVRDATAADSPSLRGIWAELRDVNARSERASPAPTEDEIHKRLRQIDQDPASRIVVATRDDTVIGMAVLMVAPLAPLVDSLAVHVPYLQVQSGQRRRGAGRALLAAAVAYAEECGAEHVVATVPPALRDANRFYASLGLAPLVVRRAASVPALRRRLASDNRLGVEEMVARRRSLRTKSRIRTAVAAVRE